MLEIKKLKVQTSDDHQTIIKDLSLSIKSGEIHAIMGPNGTGKSTLSKVIMGNNKYNLVEGYILFNNKSIINLTVDERAKSGIFLAMQDPTVVEGVTNSEFIKTAIQETTNERINYFNFIKELDSCIKNIGLSEDMLHRSLNQGFSGGEKKKNEKCHQ